MSINFESLTFSNKLFLLFGDELQPACEFFGVSLRTLYRWINNPNMVHPCALKLLDIGIKGFYLPDHAPYTDWRVTKESILTPFGSVDPFDVEYLPILKSQLIKADNAVNLMRAEKVAMLDIFSNINLPGLEQALNLLLKKYY